MATVPPHITKEDSINLTLAVTHIISRPQCPWVHL